MTTENFDQASPDTRSSNDDRMAKIQRYSRRLAKVCAFFAVLVPVCAGVYVLGFPDAFLKNARIAEIGIDISPLLSGEQSLPWIYVLAAYGALLVGIAPMVWVLLALRRLFTGYAAGAVFTVEAAHALKSVAVAMLVLAAVRPVSGALLSLSLTWPLGDGNRQLAISFGSNELWIALGGVMVLVTAWIMGEAAALAEENQSFV